jgi:protein-S-isoprenylcysteine O-methyltransferase Ste14
MRSCAPLWLCWRFKLDNWPRIARRIRVPAGFVLAVFYLWLARPSWPCLAGGDAIVAAGLVLRGCASGHLRKASELTTTGPYAYTRNPLYLGSLIIAVGFAIAARSLWIALLMAVIFAAIYLPVMSFEEQFLRAQFPDFEEYARQVPRLLPRLSAASAAGGKFSWDLYRKHREYNAALGAAGITAALIFKLIWLRS